MFGLLAIFISLVIHSVVLFFIGLGLFVDELTYVLIQGKNHDDNYSKVSIIGTIFFVVVVYFLKDYLIMFI